MSDDIASTSSLSSDFTDSESDRRRQRRRARRDRQRASAKPITTIPDLRFEQSFLASVRGFIHEVSSNEKAAEVKRERLEAEKDENEKESFNELGNADGGQAKSSSDTPSEHVDAVIATKSPRTGEPELWLGNLRIEWWSVVYLTLRDQLLSPIVQGIVMTMGGVLLGHARTAFQAHRQMREIRQQGSGTTLASRFKR